MVLYRVLKAILQNGNKNGSVTADKLDVFWAAGKLGDEQYQELTTMLQALDA